MILITGASGNAGGAVLSAASTVQGLLGKPARTLDAFLSENKAAFSSKAA